MGYSSKKRVRSFHLTLSAADLFLATDVEGIFRLSGSAKRIKDLQTVFNSPERFGKGLDWTGYTVHDAANILRRYLNQLPEPIVPLLFYQRFRDPLRPYLTKTAEGGASFDLTMDQQSQVVSAYQKLITELPPLNRQLLLYILDLLAVFSSKSDLNRMTAANLAAIFQPGILSHPDHDMAPTEYRLSQDVLIFLIENQDHFLFGMHGTGIDEETKKNVESGVPSAKSPKSNIGRSASNASAGADSLRKFGVRRNVSTGSRGSRERSSPGVSSPGTPTGSSQAPTGSVSSGVGRSNTVPSKRSPAIASGRFQRMNDSPAASPSIPDAPEQSEDIQQRSTESDPSTPKADQHPTLAPLPIPVNPATQPPGSRDRKISSLLAKSPLFGPIDPQGKKLQKRRIPGSNNESAQNSEASLPADDQIPFRTPLMTPETSTAERGDPMRTSPAVINTAATPLTEHPTLSPTSAERPNHLQPSKSPAGSVHSRSSVTDHSEFDALDTPRDPAATSAPGTSEKSQKRHRWRFSSSAKKTEDFPLAPPPRFGDNPGARGSNSSIGSAPGKAPRKSFTGDSQATTVQSGYEGGPQPSIQGHSSHESSEALRDSTNNGEEKKAGLFGKWKAKRSERKEEKREREIEKERAKSPPRSTDEPGKPRASLSAFAQEHLGARGRSSFDRSRGTSTASEGGVTPTPAVVSSGQQTEKDGAMGGLETVKERPGTEGREKEGMSGLTSSAALMTTPTQKEEDKKVESNTEGMTTVDEPVASTTAATGVTETEATTSEPVTATAAGDEKEKEKEQVVVPATTS